MKRFFKIFIPVSFHLPLATCYLLLAFVCPCFGGGKEKIPPWTEPTQMIVKGILKLEEDTKWKKILENEQKMLTDLGLVAASDLKTLTDMKRDSEIYEFRDKEREKDKEKDKNNAVGVALISIAQLIDGYGTMRNAVNRLADMDSDFRKTFFSLLEKDNNGKLVEKKKWDDDAWIKNYALQYRKLNDEIENYFRQSLGAVVATEEHIMNVAYKDDEKDKSKKKDIDKKKVMNALVAASKDPRGRNQILQIRNELLTFMTGELMEIEAVMMMQFNDYASYLMQHESNRKAFSKGMDVDLSAWSHSGSSPKKYTGILHDD